MMLAATAAWIESIAARLVGGERLLLRLPPRQGKTYLTERIHEVLGETAVLVDGADFPEGEQKAIREALRGRILEVVQAHGYAQLIFDNYPVAVNRNQGKLLDVMLNGLLIDHDVSRDIGALFTARCSAPVDRRGAGSPLMSRVQPIDPPVISDFSELGADFEQMREWFGSSALMVDLCRTKFDGSPVALVDRLEMDQSYIGDVRAVAAADLLRGKVDDQFTSYAARCAVSGLFSAVGTTALFKRLQSKFLMSEADAPEWPNSLQQSAEKFAGLLGAASEVVWVDRYMYRDIEPLRDFARRVATFSDCKLLLLGSRSVSEREVSLVEMKRLSSVPTVEARWLESADYPLLHDRHLAINGGGWVMPQVHVLVGRQLPGSAVVAPVSQFHVDYRSVWHRSSVPA